MSAPKLPDNWIDRDSPDKLTNGRWILRGHVQVWDAWGPEPPAELPPEPEPARPTACADCERDFTDMPHGGRGLCKLCYTRHHKRGTKEKYPCVKWGAA